MNVLKTKFSRAQRALKTSRNAQDESQRRMGVPFRKPPDFPFSHDTEEVVISVGAIRFTVTRRQEGTLSSGGDLHQNPTHRRPEDTPEDT